MHMAVTAPVFCLAKNLKPLQQYYCKINVTVWLLSLTLRGLTPAALEQWYLQDGCIKGSSEACWPPPRWGRGQGTPQGASLDP